jgi:hypothetical protein
MRSPKRRRAFDHANTDSPIRNTDHWLAPARLKRIQEVVIFAAAATDIQAMRGLYVEADRTGSIIEISVMPFAFDLNLIEAGPEHHRFKVVQTPEPADRIADPVLTQLIEAADLIISFDVQPAKSLIEYIVGYAITKPWSGLADAIDWRAEGVKDDDVYSIAQKLGVRWDEDMVSARSHLGIHCMNVALPVSKTTVLYKVLETAS